jgi:hypothetical protein
VAILEPPPSVPSDRDWDLSRFLRQSPRSLKTFPPAPGNHLCGGLRGGAGNGGTDITARLIGPEAGAEGRQW